MPPESRAEYFKERREKFKSFTVEVEREKMERLEKRLSEQSKTKASWLNEKIDEEIGEKKIETACRRPKLADCFTSPTPED